MPWSVVSRPLAGEVPTIDLMVGHSKTNESPVLKLFLASAGIDRARFECRRQAQPLIARPSLRHVANRLYIVPIGV
jgi:hypothetical protein